MGSTRPTFFHTSYDGLGKLIGEYSADGPPAEPMVHYTATDPLGSPRVLTNENGAVVSRRDFMPFGKEIVADQTYRKAADEYGVGDNVRQKFTGYEHDEETGLDFAEARYYYNNHGRFTSPDPVMLTRTRLLDPQRINLFVYTRNSPLKYLDPDGMDLRLKEGMSKADVNRIVGRLVDLYRKESGKQAIEQLAKSDVTVVIGTGRIPSKSNVHTNTVIDTFGTTQHDAKFVQMVETGRRVGILGKRSDVTVTITLDFQARNDAERRHEMDPNAPRTPSEQEVFDEEIGHALDMDNDLVAEANKTVDEAEATAAEFVDRVRKQGRSISESEARKRVFELLALN